MHWPIVLVLYSWISRLIALHLSLPCKSGHFVFQISYAIDRVSLVYDALILILQSLLCMIEKFSLEIKENKSGFLSPFFLFDSRRKMNPMRYEWSQAPGAKVGTDSFVWSLASSRFVLWTPAQNSSQTKMLTNILFIFRIYRDFFLALRCG